MIVLQISQHRLLQIIKCSLVRALSSAREIRLQSSCPSVCFGYEIRMIRPHWKAIVSLENKSETHFRTFTQGDINLF